MRSPSIIQKFYIHGTQETLKGYLHMANNPDGTLAGIELDIHREGTMGRAMAHAVTTIINRGLEAKIPLKVFVDEFRGWGFEPSGSVTGSPHVSQCSSLLDFVAQELEATYLIRQE